MTKIDIAKRMFASLLGAKMSEVRSVTGSNQCNALYARRDNGMTIVSVDDDGEKRFGALPRTFPDKRL
jgi:hypothetical protein